MFQIERSKERLMYDLGRILAVMDPEKKFETDVSYLKARTFKELWEQLNRPHMMIWLASRAGCLTDVNMALHALCKLVEADDPRVMPWQESLFRLNTFKPYGPADAESFYKDPRTIVRIAHMRAKDVRTVPRIIRREIPWRKVQDGLVAFGRDNGCLHER